MADRPERHDEQRAVQHTDRDDAESGQARHRLDPSADELDDLGPPIAWQIRKVGSQQHLGERIDDLVEPEVTRVGGHASGSG